MEGSHGVGAVGGRDHVRLVRDAVLGNLRVHRPGKQAAGKDALLGAIHQVHPLHRGRLEVCQKADIGREVAWIQYIT